MTATANTTTFIVSISPRIIQKTLSNNTTLLLSESPLSGTEEYNLYFLLHFLDHQEFLWGDNYPKKLHSI